MSLEKEPSSNPSLFADEEHEKLTQDFHAAEAEMAKKQAAAAQKL